MNTITKLIKELISKTNETSPRKICAYLGITILTLELGSTYGFKTNSYGVSVIYVNSFLDVPLQQFIIAHELGHIILHKGINMPFFKGPSKNRLAPRTEAEANMFAIILLLIDYFQDDSNLITIPTEKIMAQIGLPKQLNYLFFDTIEQYKKFY